MNISALIGLIACVRLSFCVKDMVILKGDAMIGGLFSIQGNTDGRCSGFSRTSMHVFEAVRWTLDKLNGRNFTPGVKLGLKAYKTCGLPARAANSTIAMLKSDTSTGNVFGVLGPEYSSETQTVSGILSSLPVQERLLQVVYSSTASLLSNRTLYRNIYRVIESDSVQVEVIIALLKQINWNYVAVAYEDDVYGRDAAATLKARAKMEGICIPIFMKISSHLTIVNLRSALDTNESQVSGFVFIGHGPTVNKILEYLDKQLSPRDFQMVVSESVSLYPSFFKDGNGRVFNYAKGVLIQVPPYKPVREFTSSWNKQFENDTVFQKAAAGASNVWLREYFDSDTVCQTDNRCRMQALKMAQQPLYVYYAVLAVAVLAQVYKNVHAAVCLGKPGVCGAMRNIGEDVFVKELENISFTPSYVVEELRSDTTTVTFEDGALIGKADAVYEVYNYTKNEGTEFEFHKVGSYNGSKLNITDTVKSRLALHHVGRCQAPINCKECLADPEDKIIHIPGDFYVVALVPVHNKSPLISSDPLSPFRYGPLRGAISVDIVEAIIFAVNVINNKSSPIKSVLQNKQIGVIILDTCNNPIITQDKIVKLHKGVLQLGDGLNSSSVNDKIIGYVGPLASSISIVLSSLMERLNNQVFVAFASTSNELRDRKRYPTFMTTAPSLEKQVAPMMGVFKSLQSTYIQILYTDESYGHSGRDAVKKGAEHAGVCIAQSVAVLDSTDKKHFIGVVNKLRKFSYAKLVVVFTRSHISDEISLGEFIFFGSGEGWANRMDIIRGNYNLKGSLSMAQAITVDPEFEKYFKDLPTNPSRNPWLSRYLEKSASCYFPESFEKKSGKLCTADRLSSNRQTDMWVPFASNAVYSLVMGFDRALDVVCNGNPGKCKEYSYTHLIQHTTTVELDIYRDGQMRRVFDDSGTGASGFKIYSAVPMQGPGELQYREVGLAIGDSVSFNHSDLDPTVDYRSSCPTEFECSKCKRETTQQPETSPWLAVSVTEAVVMVILVGVIILCRRGKGACCQKNTENRAHISEDAEYTNVSEEHGVYLHPVPECGNTSQSQTVQ